MTTKTKTKWSDQPYPVNPDEVDGERMLALSARTLKRILKAGKIWRDVDYEDTARELAKPGQWKWKPDQSCPPPGYADLKRAFDDRNLPDWMWEPAREVFDEMLSQYEQACFMKPFDLNVARIIIACQKLDNDCGLIGFPRPHQSRGGRDLHPVPRCHLRCNACPRPRHLAGSILLGPSLTAEELAR